MAKTFTLSMLVVWMALSQDALLACGDKFFLVGRGDRFARAYASLHPGIVLIYAGGTTAVSKGLGDSRLPKYITRAGHRVLIARNRLELERTLKIESVDVVIASLGQSIDLIPAVAAVPSRPTLLPVEEKGAGIPSGVQHQFAATIKETDKVNRFLARIDDVMKGRTAGPPQARK